MLFSVIIPMFNAELYICECIESVIAQEENDFELIIINDGSNDKSVELVEGYCANDSRIKLIDQQNMGLFHTRCIGIKRAIGKYIVFLDADDYLEINALQRLKEEFIDDSLDMVIYGSQSFNLKGKLPASKQLFEHGRIFEGISKQDLYKKILEGSQLNSMCFKAIKRECFDTSLFDSFPRITMSEDLLHTLRPISNSKRVKYISDILYNYRMISTSMTKIFDPDVYKWLKFVHLEILSHISIWEMDTPQNIQLFYMRFLKGIGIITLFSPSKIKLMEKEYGEMLMDISKDNLYKTAHNNAYKMLPFIYKIPIKLIDGKRFRTMRSIKSIVVRIR